ncbi:MAG: polysaccharide deacetylase family protein [Thermincola sp.]|nr:polysaccharide deacetylase family protein [Thermincola sp.]MDT3702256.1 polysaccharide deacetylase family protein [Thermincola sp.]
MINAVKITLLSLLVFVIVFFTVWQISKSRTFQFFGGITSRVETDKKIVALTFDDGPTKNTKAVLDILRELDVRATFFVTGAEMAKNPTEGRMIVLAGHELGNHSYSHTRMVFKSPAFIKKEIEETDRLIKEAGYNEEIYFRPPFGKKLVGLPYYLKKHRRTSITWDIEPETDPEIGADAQNIASYVTEKVKPGSIILLHVMYDIRTESVKSIEGVVNSLRSMGYKFVTVSELLKEQRDI